MTIASSDRLRRVAERAGYSFTSTPARPAPRPRSKRVPRWRRWLLAGGVLFSVALGAPALQAQEIGPFTYVGRTGDAPLTPLIGSSGFTVATFGDVDDDGDDDLLFGGVYLGSTTPKYYEQVRPGVFEERMSHPFEGMELYAPDLVDLDGDGTLEMVAIRPDLPDGSLMLHERNEDGVYELVQPLSLENPYVGWTAWADVDDDGDLDAFISNGYYYTPQLYIQQEPLQFEEQPEDHAFSSLLAAGEYVHSFALHDMDGDGDLDGVEGGIQTGVVVHWQVSEGVFETSARLETDRLLEAYAVSAAVTDFDGDGHPDILLTDAQGVAAGYLQQDDQRFLFDPAMEVNRSLAGRAVDMDRDGRPELVGRPLWEAGQTALYRLDEPGFVLLENQPEALRRHVDDIDLDQDGDLDLWDGGATFWAQQADGTFVQEAIPSSVAETRQILRFEDLNGDGWRDAVLSPSGAETLFRLMLRTADGSFAEVEDKSNPFPLTDNHPFDRPAFADMDADGDVDLVVVGGERLSTVETRWFIRYFERQEDAFVELETHAFTDIDLSRLYDPGNLDLA
ncbi:MAG: VCBS repeat-containing protein, partial [Bacteroidota bacterium]